MAMAWDYQEMVVWMIMEERLTPLSYDYLEGEEEIVNPQVGHSHDGKLAIAFTVNQKRYGVISHEYKYQDFRNDSTVIASAIGRLAAAGELQDIVRMALL